MASITQEEFNLMLQTAIAQGLPGGYVASKWSWEEIEAKLEMTNKTLINSQFTIPSNGAGWYRIAAMGNNSALFTIKHAYTTTNSCNLLFFAGTLPFANSSLFVLGAKSTKQTSDITVDGVRVMKKDNYTFFVDFHFSKSHEEALSISQSFLAGSPPSMPFAITKVADAPAGETVNASVEISAGTPNGILAYQSGVSAAIERGLSL